MPLAFSSLSHGTVAFGFYNINTDGMLLDRLFFFCSDFCRAACLLERAASQPDRTAEIPGYAFEDPAGIGDLMGAIRGVRYDGYLGAIYRLWPFPDDPRDFRQHLDGEKNRAEAEGVLRRWASPVKIPLLYSGRAGRYSIGPYVFSEEAYAELLAYVHRGGYPTWEGFERGRAPPCVAELGLLLGGLPPTRKRGEDRE